MSLCLLIFPFTLNLKPHGHLFQQDMVSQVTNGEIKALRVLGRSAAYIPARYGSTGNYWRDK